jgi:hypothetical protein
MEVANVCTMESEAVHLEIQKRSHHNHNAVLVLSVPSATGGQFNVLLVHPWVVASFPSLLNMSNRLCVCRICDVSLSALNLQRVKYRVMYSQPAGWSCVGLAISIHIWCIP